MGNLNVLCGLDAEKSKIFAWVGAKYFEFSAEKRVEHTRLFPYFLALTFEERVKTGCLTAAISRTSLTAFFVRDLY